MISSRNSKNRTMSWWILKKYAGSWWKPPQPPQKLRLWSSVSD